jgi:hypothetical protein
LPLSRAKAFDCLPHDLLILKLKTYGVSPSALNLIDSYLKNRKQCVKVGPHISNWQDVYCSFKDFRYHGKDTDWPVIAFI